MRVLQTKPLTVLVMGVILVGIPRLAEAQRGVGAGHGEARGAGPQPTARPSNGVRLAGPNTGGRPYPIRTDIAPPTGLIPPAAAYTGISPGGLKTINRGGHSRYPIVPVFAPPIYYPGFYDSAFSSNVAPYNDQGVDPTAANSTMMANQDAMADQIRQLSWELEHMRSTPPATEAAAATAPSLPPTTADPASQTQQIPIQIVLRNGQQFTVKSFAVMNGTLWDFSSNHARRIPVSTVDIGASTKATEAKGGEFPSLSKD